MAEKSATCRFEFPIQRMVLFQLAICDQWKVYIRVGEPLELIILLPCWLIGQSPMFMLVKSPIVCWSNWWSNISLCLLSSSRNPHFCWLKSTYAPPNFCWYSIAGELNIYFQFFDGRLGYPFPSSSPCTGRLNSSCESSLRPSRRARCAWDRGASSDGDARNTGQYTCDGCRSV